MTDYFDIVDDAIDSLKAQVAILYYDCARMWQNSIQSTLSAT